MAPARILAMHNRIRNYAWGSHHLLAELQGRPAPTREPEAELWIGAHPAAPSSVVVDGVPVPLQEWIARDPDAALGANVAARFGGKLPFLVKILAVGAPLSVQVHPDDARAKRGFEAEEQAGVPPEDPARRYPDPRGKPEMVCALGDFEVLAGFRPPSEIARSLERLAIPALRGVCEALRRDGEAGGLARGLAALLAARAEGGGAALVADVVRALQRNDGAGPESACLAQLASAWPNDPAVLTACFLRRETLSSGEGLFVAPGTLHCYLEGAALEVQASSDNTLRAGLTIKAVDVDAVLATVRFDAAPLERLHGGAYPVRAEAFCLAHLRVDGGAGLGAVAGPQIVVCADGELAVGDGCGAPVELRRGEAAWIGDGSAEVRVTGRGAVHHVRVPD